MISIGSTGSMGSAVLLLIVLWSTGRYYERSIAETNNNVLGILTPPNIELPKSVGAVEENLEGIIHSVSTMHNVRDIMDRIVDNFVDHTHGYTNYDVMSTIVNMVVVIAIVRYVIYRWYYRYFGNKEEVDAFCKEISWNTVSIIFCFIVSHFALYMVFHMLRSFIYELRIAYSECGMSIFYSDCYNFTIKHQIFNLDHRSTSETVMIACLLIVSYFTYDIIFNITTSMNTEYFLHHVLAIACCSIYIYTESYAFYLTAGMITELSTICLSSGIYFKRGSRMKTLITMAFAITFFFSRIILLSTVILIALLIESGSRLYTITTSYALLSALNWYWFILIIKKAMRKVL